MNCIRICPYSTAARFSTFTHYQIAIFYQKTIISNIFKFHFRYIRKIEFAPSYIDISQIPTICPLIF